MEKDVTVIFASYDNGKLTSVKTVPMPANGSLTRNPKANDFENGETVKIFVWDSLNNPAPIMDAKEFRKD